MALGKPTNGAEAPSPKAWVASLVREVMRLQRAEWRAEIDALVSGIEDPAVRERVEHRLWARRKQFQDAAIARMEARKESRNDAAD